MDTATVQVRMDNLKIEADIAVGSRGNPTVTNTFRNIAEVSLFAHWTNILQVRRNTLLGILNAAVSTMLGPSVISLQAHVSILLSRPICCSTSHGHIAVASAEACCSRYTRGTLCHVRMHFCNVG